MRAALLCVLVLACAPAVAAAQTATTPAPVATTGVPPVTSTAPATTTTQPVTQVEINAPGPTEDDVGPTPLAVGLLVALALAVVAFLAWALLRLTAWEPGWLPQLRHSVGEAGYRFGATWAQFRDWFSPRHR